MGLEMALSLIWTRSEAEVNKKILNATTNSQNDVADQRTCV